MQTLSDYGYQYATASAIERSAAGSNIGLAHAAELEAISEVPCFFWGRLRDAYLTAKCLSAVAKTVRSRFALTAQDLAAMRDPIVTAGQSQLRFEGFSSCNGVYARLDLLPEALDGEFLASGTTNVDFNEPMLHALNGIARAEAVTLAVGQESVSITTARGGAIEKKVALPQRWIKGLTSVQHYLADMEEQFVLNRAQAVQLFQSLPKSTVKGDLYIVQRAGKMLFSPLKQGKAVRVGGAHRLRLMEGLLPFMDAMHIYASGDGAACGFLITLGNLQMIFAFSADPYRGFSGEGKALEFLVDELPLELVYAVNALMSANEPFSPTLLSLEHDISFATGDALTANLSSIGLLGFDLLNNQHFYRRLPFRTERILSLNPRLKNARKLVAADDLTIHQQRPGYVEARVRGSQGVQHTVILENGSGRCTCEWYTKYQGGRGLCKHVLALRIATENP